MTKPFSRIPSEEDISDFDFAISSGNTAAVKKFLDEYGLEPFDKRPVVYQTPLMHAAHKGRLEIVTLLLDRGADINKQNAKYKMTALLYAASEGHAEVVAFLLDRGADADIRNVRGMTALQKAEEEDHPGVVSLLKAWPEQVEKRELAADIASFTGKLTRPMKVPRKLSP